MSNATIAVLHPGDMGSAIGACAVRGGHKVLCALEGRSSASKNRANAAGMQDSGNEQAAVLASSVVLSVCPPHGALDLARRVAGFGFKGLFVDANAIAPAYVLSPMVSEQLTPAQRATRDRWVEHGPGILMLCTTSRLGHGLGRSAGAAGGDGLLLALSREEEGEVPPVRRSFRLTEAIRNASSHQDRKMRPTAPRRRSTFTNLQTFTL